MWRGRSDLEMPLARYFLFVGGLLVALLFVMGSMSPKFPMTESADLGGQKSFLKIDSDRKWPERIVFDASAPTIVPAQTATTEEAAEPMADAPVDVSPKTRDAFAQLQPSDQKKPEPKPHPKRKLAKKHVTPPRVLVAEQPRFGFFSSSIW
jgi:hypothetical protein